MGDQRIATSSAQHLDRIPTAYLELRLFHLSLHPLRPVSFAILFIQTPSRLRAFAVIFQRQTQQ